MSQCANVSSRGIEPLVGAARARRLNAACLEALEGRLLLSVAIEQRGDALFILGDKANDTVYVADLGGGHIHVAAAGKRGEETFSYKGVARVIIDTGAGDDVVHYQAGDRGDPTKDGFFDRFADISISTGPGNDSVFLKLDGIKGEANARVDLGAGNDIFELDATGAASRTGDPYHIKFKLDAGAGNDNVKASFHDLFVDAFIDLGAGNDTAATDVFLKIEGIKGESATARPDINLDIKAGAGNDDVTVALLLPAVQKVREAAVRVDLGAGNDTFAIDARGTASSESLSLNFTKIELNAGAGNDNVKASFEDLFVDAAIDLGAGDDTAAADVFMKYPDLKISSAGARPDINLDIKAGAGNDDVTVALLLPAVQKVREAAVRVDLGAGNDVFAIDATGAASRTGEPYHHIKYKLDAGAGNDTVRASFQDVFVDAAIDLGAGDDTAELRAGYLKIGDIKGESIDRPDINLDIKAGAGNDVVTVALLLPAVQKVREAAVRLDGGPGNDLLTLEINGAVDPTGAPAVKAVVDGGPGRDTAYVSEGVKVLNVETVHILSRPDLTGKFRR